MIRWNYYWRPSGAHEPTKITRQDAEGRVPEYHVWTELHVSANRCGSAIRAQPTGDLIVQMYDDIDDRTTLDALRRTRQYLDDEIKRLEALCG